MKLAILAALVLTPAAQADQTFRCRDKEQGVTVTLKLTNETARVNTVKATSKVTGFWKEGRDAWGTGVESTIPSSLGDKMYWDQVEGKPTVTVWTEDKHAPQISYHFTFSRELLGAEFERRKVNGWIDPDFPEGGGYPLDLLCSSAGSQ